MCLKTWCPRHTILPLKNQHHRDIQQKRVYILGQVIPWPFLMTTTTTTIIIIIQQCSSVHSITLARKPLSLVNENDTRQRSRPIGKILNPTALSLDNQPPAPGVFNHGHSRNWTPHRSGLISQSLFSIICRLGFQIFRSTSSRRLKYNIV